MTIVWLFSSVRSFKSAPALPRGHNHAVAGSHFSQLSSDSPGLCCQSVLNYPPDSQFATRLLPAISQISFPLKMASLQVLPQRKSDATLATHATVQVATGATTCDGVIKTFFSKLYPRNNLCDVPNTFSNRSCEEPYDVASRR